MIFLDNRGCWRVVASSSVSVIDSVDLVVMSPGGPVIVRAALRNGNELTQAGQEALVRHGLIGDFFDSPAAEWYLDTDDDLAGEKEILDDLERVVRLTGRPVLDVCCGRGRLSIPLLERGLEVHGVDISGVSVEKAYAKAEAGGFAGRFTPYVADVANFARPSYFGAAVAAANSLRYLGSLRRIDRHLELMAASLVPGGVYAVEIDTKPVPGGGRWSIPRGELRWEVLSVDTLAQESLERVVVRNLEGEVVAEELQPQVAIGAGEFMSAAESHGLSVSRILDQRLREIDRTEAEEEAGNLWYILER